MFVPIKKGKSVGKTFIAHKTIPLFDALKISVGNNKINKLKIAIKNPNINLKLVTSHYVYIKIYVCTKFHMQIKKEVALAATSL